MLEGIKVFWNMRGEVSIEIPQVDGGVWAFVETFSEPQPVARKIAEALIAIGCPVDSVAAPQACRCKGCGYYLSTGCTECPKCGSCGPRSGGMPPIARATPPQPSPNIHALNEKAITDEWEQRAGMVTDDDDDATPPQPDGTVRE